MQNSAESDMIDIDVIIPCYNSGDYIEKSITSALEQKGNFNSLHVTIIDDRSDDRKTIELLQKIRHQDRVTVLSNPGEKGSAAARNYGISKTKGNWIAFLDADDWWPSNSVAHRLSALTAHPNSEWIGGDFVELNRNGDFEKEPKLYRNLNAYPFLSEAYGPNQKSIQLNQPLGYFLDKIPTVTIATMLTRSLFERSGGFKVNLLRAQDVHLWMRLAEISSFTYTPEVVAYYRLHENNSTRSLTETQSWHIVALQDLLKKPLLKDYRKKIKEKIYTLHLSNSFEFRKSSDYIKAFHSARSAITEAPYSYPAWRSLIGSILRK